MRMFYKKLDGQWTQSIIKNLNLKKSKRFWNQNFIEVNDYAVKTNYFIIILLIFQIANVLCPFKILRRCTENFTKTLHALFSSKLFFQHEPENRFWCLLHSPISKTLIMELSYMVFKYFVLISNNNTMNPTFFPCLNTSWHM